MKDSGLMFLYFAMLSVSIIVAGAHISNAIKAQERRYVPFEPYVLWDNKLNIWVIDSNLIIKPKVYNAYTGK